MHIVDTHPHIVADDLQKYPLSPIGGKLSEYAKEHKVTAEQFIRAMDEAGVDQTAMVQSSTGHGYDNSYLADSVARFPDRLVGVCCVDAAAADAPERLRYWINERGMSGVRLFTTGSTVEETDWLDKPVAVPFFEEAQKLGVPVTIQIRRTGMPMFVNIVRRYPTIRFILDHMAKPVMEDGAPYEKAKEFFALASYPNVYLKFTTINMIHAGQGQSTPTDFFTAVIEKFGADKIMWGSNYPSIWRDIPADSYRSLVDFALVTLADFPLESRRWLFGGTAQSLFPGASRLSSRA